MLRRGSACVYSMLSDGVSCLAAPFGPFRMGVASLRIIDLPHLRMSLVRCARG